MDSNHGVRNEDSAQETRPGSGSLDNRWLIIVMLFFVVGALGIPAIWMSGVFSRRAKIALTVVVCLYTAACLAGCWFLLTWLYRYARPAFS